VELLEPGLIPMTVPSIGPFQRIVAVSWAWGKIRIRYIWTAGGGRDLDTKTYVSFGGTQLGGSVGWSFGDSASTYRPESVQLLDLLHWVSGDNTSQGGEEYVDANLDSMLTYAASSSDPSRPMVITCSAHWFGEPGNGQVFFRVDRLEGAPGLSLSRTVTVSTRYNNPQMIARILVNGPELQFL